MVRGLSYAHIEVCNQLSGWRPNLAERLAEDGRLVAILRVRIGPACFCVHFGAAVSCLAVDVRDVADVIAWLAPLPIQEIAFVRGSVPLR